MRVLALGDVHGAVRALRQVLQRAGFDPQKDRIIFLGDAVDGWPESREVLEVFLTIRDFVWVRGNHDQWFQEWFTGFPAEDIWLLQGGKSTLDSYRDYPGQKIQEIQVPQSHKDLLLAAKPWHQEGNKIFVHGGWNARIYSHPGMEGVDNLMWDRNLWERARDRQLNHDHYDPNGPQPKSITGWEEVYIGHTTTSRYSLVPVRACEVWNLDQGAGWQGKLTLMDIHTKEYWQSDMVQDLYRGISGR